MKIIITACLIVISVSGCTNGDQSPDNVQHMKQNGVGSKSSTNATSNQELDTPTKFSFMSNESYHQGENPLESDNTRDARGFNNSPATPNDTSLNRRLSGSSTETKNKAKSSSDQIVEKLQKRIQSDKDLSNLAQRVKVVKINDQIFLTGNVQNQEEKQRIENMAHEMASDQAFTSQLEVLKK